ncbi:AraC family transcriptional regulator [Paenibacillus nanensis]|uniref:AraC family transcriptional regulator n=1 Tax=Paenibacillus nanensis TaxID=393251 RepID=A0A3A1V2T8_9BACL|nr:AraC family transcriptional regulator [Paenibacillus nanensis]RIX53672.1 AraC family transcriptional regulator [Paenibacillus nanensis]
MNNYNERINKVIQFMEQNLSSKISLDELADVAHFSKYHFSRVFTSIVGSTPSSYLSSKRLQKSIHYLTDTDKTVLEIALLCGFESASNFNLAFKKHFNKTPSEVRRGVREDSNISLYQSNNREDAVRPPRYDEGGSHHFLRRIWNMNVTIKELPSFEVAFFRHVGSYLETYHAWEKLGEWASQNGLFPPEQSFIGISLDDPSVTEEYACRYDACVTIPDGFQKDVHPHVQFQSLPGGLYGMYQFYDTVDKFGILYQSLFGQWLPNSGYDPDDRHCLEFSMNNPAEDPEGKAKIDLYVPIKKRA